MEEKKNDLIFVCRLYEKKDRNEKIFYQGKLGGAKILAFHKRLEEFEGKPEVNVLNICIAPFLTERDKEPKEE